jgi:nitrogen-specific signal transduction histidine kinase/CheY-like chemotaxis protein
LSIARDITERKQLEQQLLQAQKFEALGTLAGGIAHDFNNLLMGIQGRASLMEINLSKNDPLYEHVRGIEEYVKSAAGLTQQLLGLTRSGKYENIPLDINKLLRKNATMFGRTRKEISLHIDTATEKIIVEADRQQLEQVLLNLFVNSWQAMPGGGYLFLRTSTLYIDESFSGTHQIAPGHYGKIEVTDSGIGMDEETRKRAFDPFFTTKEIGRGTGLGLASAFGIIKNHGGVITIYSEKGRGTTINIYLPLSTKEARQEIPVENGLLKGSETILLVDDEELVSDVGKAMLEAQGYTVKTAMSGSEAISIFRADNLPIDLVIIDFIMPGMDGGKTFEGIRQIRADVPILLSSGYSLNGQISEILQKGCNGFIQKPFNIAELSKKIRTILDP